MLTREASLDIGSYARRGVSIREISRLTGFSRNTVRRHLREADPTVFRGRGARARNLDAYEDYLRGRIASASPDWIPGSVLFREIRERGYTGGASTLRAWLAEHKPRPDKSPAVRFETSPGVQMQADFVTVRVGSSPLHAFVATLGYSRASFVRFSTRQDAASLLTGLREAFDFLGGVPREILFDNAKTVVSERDWRGPGEHRWNPALADLAEECGFVPRVCRPYRAQTKGKVERFNRYLRRSFLVPLKARLKADGLVLDESVANHAVRLWLHEIANERVHATTGGIPNELLKEEHPLFLPPPRLACAPVARDLMPFPVESLQHPLSDYDALLGRDLREAMEVCR